MREKWSSIYTLAMQLARAHTGKKAPAGKDRAPAGKDGAPA